MARRLTYFARETTQAIRRNGLIAFAAVSTAFIALFLLGFAILVQREVNLLIVQTEANVEVSAYLDDTISTAQQDHLSQIISAMPQVKSVTYESKAQAYIRFKQIFANQQSLIQNVSPDALPASFRIQLNDASQFNVVASQLQGQPGIAKIVTLRGVYDRLLSVTRIFRIGGIVVAILMLVSAAALIGNTVRMAVFDRRTEIGIMRRVGATNWTIRVPFVIEGLVEGMFGAALAIIGLFLVKRTVVDPLRNKIGFLALVGNHDVIVAAFWIIPVAAAVSVLAAMFATSRFLEV
jgi:cell division transport system permease protein